MKISNNSTDYQRYLTETPSESTDFILQLKIYRQWC